MKALALVLLAACGSSTPAPTEPVATTPPVETAAPLVDAAPAPPAEPQASEALLASPAWMFRYATPDRTETWTLRVNAGESQIIVENAQGPRTYLGTATDGDKSVAIAATSSMAKITLDCKKSQRPIGETCNTKKTKKVDVLDCYVPDFKEPMPFALAPGIEYVVEKGCTGYRQMKP